MSQLVKGMRVRAAWLEARPPRAVSLAGVQTKVAAKQHVVEGLLLLPGVDDPCVTVVDERADRLVVESAQGLITLSGQARTLLWPPDTGRPRYWS